jgi:hypothetical protein
MAQPFSVSVATAIFLLVAVLDVATADAKRVLMLHSFGQDSKPWRDYAKTIRAELLRQSPWPRLSRTFKPSTMAYRGGPLLWMTLPHMVRM